MNVPVRVGVLGSGAVVEYALLQPARSTQALRVDAIASRDLMRATEYGRTHGIARCYGHYDELLSDESLDAIYVALPNALHPHWSIEALRRGYAVLCEKPLACNAQQATAMVEESERTGQLLMEGFHWRHHPLAARLTEIIASGALGTLQRIEAFFHVPRQLLDPANIRLNFALGGGSMLDQGCYCVSLVRLLSPSEPRVVAAEANVIAADVDGAMSVVLDLGSGIIGQIECSMNRETDRIASGARIRGERGDLVVENPFLPGLGSRLIIHSDAQTIEQPSTLPSYDFQARAFATAVQHSVAPWSARDSIANLRVIDAAYRAAGLRARA